MTTMEEDYKLKPCPACHAKAFMQHMTLYNNETNDVIYYPPFVAFCDCGIQTRECNTAQEAADIWNRRDA